MSTLAEDQFSESQASAAPEAVEVSETSDTIAPDTPPAEEVVGQAEVEGQTAEPEVPALSLDEYGNHLVPIKVNGETQMVPIAEAVNGYQRQADYTRSKQQLARAEAIQTALSLDPERTLRVLADEYGVGEFVQRGPQIPVDENPTTAPTADPTVSALQAQVQHLMGIQAEAELNRTLAGLEQKYGDLYDEQELIAAARRAEIQSPAELEKVFRDLTFDKVYAQASAQKQYAESGKSEDANRAAAVERAQALVSSGNGANGSVSSAQPVINSVQDAYELAKKQLGS